MGLILLGLILGFSLVALRVPQVFAVLFLLIAIVVLSAVYPIRQGIVVKQHSDVFNRARRFQRLGALSAVVCFLLMLALQRSLVEAEGIQGTVVLIGMVVSLILAMTFFFLADSRYW
ncbi:MAG TPA: hypothetical protein VMZ06_12680 [Candidatus Bathyarchaeia archaeon]|nr:hypothetical protein [Candidatus Bathyarchaeia archaeon]